LRDEQDSHQGIIIHMLSIAKKKKDNVQIDQSTPRTFTEKDLFPKVFFGYNISARGG
jgi:hypothetical protein